MNTSRHYYSQMKDTEEFCNLHHKGALKKIHVLFNPVIGLRKS